VTDHDGCQYHHCFHHSKLHLQKVKKICYYSHHREEKRGREGGREGGRGGGKEGGGGGKRGGGGGRDEGGRGEERRGWEGGG